MTLGWVTRALLRSAGAITPPPPPPASTLELGGFFVATRGDTNWPGAVPATTALALTTARHTVAQACLNNAVHQFSGSSGVLGGDPSYTSTTAYSAYDWTVFDKRTAETWVSRKPGGKNTAILMYAPWWAQVALNGAGTAHPTRFGVTVGTALGTDACTVADASVDDVAAFYEYACHRAYLAGNPFTHAVVGQEIRGYFVNTARASSLPEDPGGTIATGQWDIWRYAHLYNAVWRRFKTSTYADVRRIKIGGPYIVARRQLDRFTSQVAYNGDSVRSGNTVAGTSAHMDSKVLNAVLKFAGDGTSAPLVDGIDFLAFDMGFHQSTTDAAHSDTDMWPTSPYAAGTAGTGVSGDGSLYFIDDDLVTQWGLWLNGHWPTIPAWSMETYPGTFNSAADHQLMIDRAKAGKMAMLCFWIPNQAQVYPNNPSLGTQLWDPTTYAQNAVGDVLAAAAP